MRRRCSTSWLLRTPMVAPLTMTSSIQPTTQKRFQEVGKEIYHGAEQSNWVQAERIRQETRIQSSKSHFKVQEAPEPSGDGAFIGIDLGTSNSCISYIDKKTLKPKIIPSPTGSWVFPTAITFDRNHTRRTFGEEAKANIRISSSSTLSSGKRLIGRRFGEMSKVNTHFSKTNVVSMNERGETVVELAGKNYTVVHVTGMFLRYLKAEAERYLGESVEQVVVSVPADFSPQQKVATEDAALIAGFDVLEVIDEPTAACLTSTVLESEESARNKQSVTTSLVFDLGGGTLDCALMDHDKRSDEFRLVATHGDPMLGGNDWDAALTAVLIEGFQKKWGIDLEDPFGGQISYADMRTLQWEAEKAKIHFTSSEEPYRGYHRTFHFSERHRDVLPLEAYFTHQEYLDLTKPLRERCIETLDRLFEEIGRSPQTIDRVLLVGAMTRDPPLRRDLEAYFGKSVADEATCPADYAVAIGAAVRGGMLRGMYPKLTSHTQFVLGTTQDKNTGNMLKRTYNKMKAAALIKRGANPNAVGKRWRNTVQGLSDHEIVEYAKELVEFEAQAKRREQLDELEAEANELMKRVIKDSSRRQGQQEKKVTQLVDQLKFWQYMVHNFHDHEEHLETVVAQLSEYMDELEGIDKSKAQTISGDGKTIDFGSDDNDGPKVLRREIPLPRSGSTEELSGLAEYGHPGLAEAAKEVEGGIDMKESTRQQMFEATISDRAWREPPAPPNERDSWGELRAQMEQGSNPAAILPREEVTRPMTLKEMRVFLAHHFPIDDPPTYQAAEEEAKTRTLGTMHILNVEVPPAVPEADPTQEE